MKGLDDLTDDSIDDEMDLETIVFINPEGELAEELVHDEEKAREYYEVVKWLKSRLGSDSSNLVGKFLVAVKEVEDNDNPQKLKDFLEQLDADIDVQ